MIVKMNFVSLTGPKEDLDRMAAEYLSRYEIHLENALAGLEDSESLKPWPEENPYREWLGKAREYGQLLPEHTSAAGKHPLPPAEAIRILQTLSRQLNVIEQRKKRLEEQYARLEKSLQDIRPFLGFDYNIHRVLQFRFIKYRFGRIAADYYEKFETWVYENLDTVFFKCAAENSWVWGVYFVPSGLADQLDTVFSSMHFERIYLPDSYDETPEAACLRLTEALETCRAQIASCRSETAQTLILQQEEILSARSTLETHSARFDIRRYAACTAQKEHAFYILCGWMPQPDAARLAEEAAADPLLFCTVEDASLAGSCRPPTLLKNPKLFRPFELFVQMYGLPSYQEIDPTIFVGLTYALLFGAMFGDVGQGFCLLAGGALLYHLKKLPLAGIISRVGFFSMVFGFLYGSFFGFEDVLPALWLRPGEQMLTLPFFGRINTVFAAAIAFGMFLILSAMVFHIINARNQRNTEGFLFDANGLAGFLFYAAAIIVIGLFLTGHALPGIILLAILFGIPLLFMALKAPLTRLLQKQAELFPEGKAMFAVQAFFELFEVLLGCFSNTLSFVRVGAFAVSHAAMMEVVLMLAGAENGSAPNWLIILLGNLFVIGMEGLVVGIQVLRLEYYEMFSRFYQGGGRAFVPFGAPGK